MQDEPERIAQAVGPDLRAIGVRIAVEERVVGRRGAVVVDAQDLAVETVEILRAQVLVGDAMSPPSPCPTISLPSGAKRSVPTV